MVGILLPIHLILSGSRMNELNNRLTFTITFLRRLNVASVNIFENR